MCPTRFFVVLIVFSVAAPARCGLHYSGEQFAELPSQWRGFLLDQRMLRLIAVKPSVKVSESAVRKKYREEAARLRNLSRQRKLDAGEAADLGALLIRLAELDEALAVLREAQGRYANHYRVVANLGTAWQLQGDLDRAEMYLQQAVRLAPGKFEPAEQLHLKLVRVRKRKKNPADLDDLFGIRYVAEKGEYVAGRILPEEKKKLPANAVAQLQQLALWLPGDGLLLWQLAELANAFGDVRTAAAIMEGCVTEFGLNHPELRRHRRLTREAADALADKSAASLKTEHSRHVAGVKPRSNRPLLNRLVSLTLPEIDPKGINPLPWDIVIETKMDRKYKPTFHPYLKQLDGKQVRINGFMQPLSNNPDVVAFMLIEYPVGCWYCESPGVTGIILVELPPGKTTPFTRNQIQVTGTLTLNDKDPENFLYLLGKAQVEPLK
ncbi:MAG: hypothetical protein KatS3mg105_2589 [Gemmatales bacterium]|nr:MAG: hypothetical protein KatS3mg105_2589 [Gemmatales bacterium]